MSDNIARHIESTLLRANSTRSEIDALCAEARELQILAVCVSPVWVKRAANYLRGSAVKVVTTAGFPLGSELTTIKVAQAVSSIAAGAAEVDMVLNIGALKSGMLDWAQADMAAVAAACHARGALTKVILETCLLNESEKELACRLAVDAGVDFLKTSTGLSTGGATVADIQLMRRCAPPGVGVKAAGGIRDLPTARAMLAAGAERIGTSAGAAIVRAALV